MVEEQMGLQGHKTEIYLKVIDYQYRAKEADLFQLGVADRYRGHHWMECIAVDNITEAPPLANQDAARLAFHHAPEEVFHRPEGPVGILLSMSERNLHAMGGETKGKLPLSNTPLTPCGKVITGLSLPSSSHGVALSAAAFSIFASHRWHSYSTPKRG